MGISDEAYADALVYERQKITSTNTGVTLNANNVNSTTITGTWENRSSLHTKTLNEQDLHHEAMKAPLSALVDMWTMRWQGEWVNEKDFISDDFWRLALIRLVGANKLEKHNLANQYTAVYRIIE